MPYCTKADILERISSDELARLTDDENGTTVEDDLVSRAIDDADSEIDTYLAVRHSLPLPSVPRLLLKLSADMAVFYLYDRRMGAPEPWEKRYKRSIATLELLAQGKVSLGLSTGAEPPASGAAVEVSSNERRFTRDKLIGF